MSKVQIEIPDDRWFRGSWNFRPEDEEICVVVFVTSKYESGCNIDLKLARYLECHDVFVDLYYDVPSTPIVWKRSEVDFWKPLGLDERTIASKEEE